MYYAEANRETDASLTPAEKANYPYTCHGCFDSYLVQKPCGLCTDSVYGITRERHIRRVTEFAHNNTVIVNGKTYFPPSYSTPHRQDTKKDSHFRGSYPISDKRLMKGPPVCNIGAIKRPGIYNLPCRNCCEDDYERLKAVSEKLIQDMPVEEISGMFILIEEGRQFKLIPHVLLMKKTFLFISIPKVAKHKGLTSFLWSDTVFFFHEMQLTISDILKEAFRVGSKDRSLFDVTKDLLINNIFIIWLTGFYMAIISLQTYVVNSSINDFINGSYNSRPYCS